MVEVDLILEVEEEVGVNQDEPSVVSYRLPSHLQVLHFDLLLSCKTLHRSRLDENYEVCISIAFKEVSFCS